MPAIANILDVAAPNFWERERQGFISSLRLSVMVDVGAGMRETWEQTVQPTLAAPAADAREIRQAMADRRIYRFYSALRYNAQEMVFESVRPQVERNAEAIGEAVARASAVNPAGGSLSLDPAVEIPAYLSALDTHLLPGGFYRQTDMPNDALQGARSVLGSAVFGAGIKNYNIGGPGATIAHFLSVRHPDFRPQTIVDLGCTAGRNTVPYLERFPDAKVYGVDVSAPLLRFGHAQAESAGHPIHFVQANASTLPFADESIDFITSAFFLHELPVKLTQAILAECHRVLRPGGMMIMFELPANKCCDPYHNFYLDWDRDNNNEPHYAAYRAQDPVTLCAEAGFAPDNFFENQLLNWGTVSEEEFAVVARGERVVKPGWGGASWYTFGAMK